MPLLLLAVFLALAVASPAQAAFSGSNGKVAWLDSNAGLVIDDPFDDKPAPPPVVMTANGVAEQSASAPRSAPAWSPDGTRIAYTEAIPDTSPYKDHSAVYVINADGSGRKRVTTPYAAVVPCNQCDNGEQTWDLSPVWTPDGDIAFIRWVAADDQAIHIGEVGTSVWTVDPDSGVAGKIKHVDPDDVGVFQSIIWPTGWSEPLSVFVSDSGFTLRKVLSDTTFATELGFSDLDASPDGEKISYGAVTMSGQQIVVKDKDGAEIERFSSGLFQAWNRFTPDGNGLVRAGCADDPDGNPHCGWITHRLPDPDADVRPDDPVEMPYVDMNLGAVAFPDQPGNRPMFDIQSQDLPLIYAPGFLGSQILCDGESVWMPAAPPLTMAPMSLGPDGKSNAACPGAGPSGEVVDEFMLADVYGHANDWLEAMNPPGGWATFGWDWRKAPQESIDDLDGLIDSMLLNDLPEKQGASRVSLVGHSYGGLLIRTYVDDEVRAKKVARVLTVGAPYHGAPKSLFGVSFGVELPSFSALDLMIDNADLKSFMANLAGGYHLFPSDSYGGWLRLNATQLDQAGVANWVSGVGANATLLESAWATHRDHIDGFYDRNGRIDYRAVVGLGLPTIGAVNLVQPGADGETVTAGVHYENGDGTVPGRSATQGPIGTTDPMGDDVHIQNRCGIPHMDQTKDKVVQGAYAQFLLFGRLPRKLPAAECPPEGKEIEVFRGLEIPPPTGAAAARSTAAGAPMTLGDAEFAGLIDILELPGRTVIVTDDRRPAPVAFEADGLSFAITALKGDERGQRLLYGPLTGTVAIADGAVTVDGAPVAGTPDGGDGGGDDGDGGGNDGGDDGDGGVKIEPTPTPTPTATPTADPKPQAPRLAIAARKLRAKKGVVAIKVTASAPFSGTLTLRAKKLGTIGRASVRLTAAGSVTVKVKLSAKARRARRLAATLTVGSLKQAVKITR